MPSLISSALPTKQTAIVAEGAGKLSLRHDAPVPTLGPNVAMVKTAAVAINPVDAKMLDYSPVPGAIHGYDFAGTIVALGDGTPAYLKVGDRVAGTVHGMNPSLPDVGAFAEYVAAPGDLLLQIPDWMSFEEASSIGLSLFTAGLGLFQELKVPSSTTEPYAPRPDDEYDFGPEFVLVAGGATATGTRAIQLLKLAGLRPIATCSPSNFELVRSFGAEEVFDYHTADCAAEIKTYTRNTLAYAFDCVAMADTMQLCYAAMGRAGGRYVTLEPFRHAIASTRPTIKPSWLLALTIFGLKVNLEGEYKREASPEDRKFGETFTLEMQKLLNKGTLAIHPVQVRSGGWEGVLNGVDFIRKETMSGQKLVYSV
ncbi:hypothetical protein UA08_05016 [Talaromyces atroroseus]|uniref:Enoyl reductase (ER) domain-containing protein n=1 Tax=Talaromyces atroroseus TaxID=1441469 RepID=A0A225AJL9_TALAT|nr:hypothetical protein UA08_05016 [Talaromyces atroroseus]OKL59563.1 hypothetical protein UA08_05016 [Talaromyces atroroseus]